MLHINLVKNPHPLFDTTRTTPGALSYLYYYYYSYYHYYHYYHYYQSHPPVLYPSIEASNTSITNLCLMLHEHQPCQNTAFSYQRPTDPDLYTTTTTTLLPAPWLTCFILQDVFDLQSIIIFQVSLCFIFDNLLFQLLIYLLQSSCLSYALSIIIIQRPAYAFLACLRQSSLVQQFHCYSYLIILAIQFTPSYRYTIKAKS